MKGVYINFIRRVPHVYESQKLYQMNNLLKEFQPTIGACVSYTEQPPAINEPDHFLAPILGGNCVTSQG